MNFPLPLLDLGGGVYDWLSERPIHLISKHRDNEWYSFPLIGERIPRNCSGLEPLNRSSRRKEALTSLAGNRMSLLTSAATRFMASLPPSSSDGQEWLNRLNISRIVGTASLLHSGSPMKTRILPGRLAIPLLIVHAAAAFAAELIASPTNTVRI